MKQSHLLLVFLATCLTFLVACSKKEKVQSVDFISFSIAGACEGSVLKSSTEKEKTIVITSEQEKSKEIGCFASAPHVDFNTHFLLAGRVAFTNCAELEEETIVEEGNTLKYYIFHFRHILRTL